MNARIFSRWGKTNGLEFTIATEATIGRAATNSIVLDFSAVSGQHARIYFDDKRGCYLLEDLGSLNGTRVDGVKVERPMRLERLHVLNFGRVCEFVFQRLEEEGAAAPGAGEEGARPEAGANPGDGA